MKKIIYSLLTLIILTSPVHAQNNNELTYKIYGIEWETGSFEKYRLKVRVENLPTGTLGAEGTLSKVLTDNGEDLLPSEENRKIDGKLDFFDKTKLTFDINMKLPSKNAKELKEISGQLFLLTSGGPQTAELGLVKLQAGQTLSKFDGKIESLETSGNEQSLTITLALPNNRIKRVQLFKPDGNEYSYNDGIKSWSASGSDNYSITFYNSGKFPAELKIMVEYHGEPKKIQKTLSISDLTLQGNPLTP